MASKEQTRKLVFTRLEGIQFGNFCQRNLALRCQYICFHQLGLSNKNPPGHQIQKIIMKTGTGTLFLLMHPAATDRPRVAPQSFGCQRGPPTQHHMHFQGLTAEGLAGCHWWPTVAASRHRDTPSPLQPIQFPTNLPNPGNLSLYSDEI